MRLPDWKTCAGYAVVVAALALSLPGVKVVRADEQAPVISVNLIDSGPQCEAGPASGPSSSATVYLGSDPDPSEKPAPVALNTQGYSYRPPAVDPEAREFEHH